MLTIFYHSNVKFLDALTVYWLSRRMSLYLGSMCYDVSNLILKFQVKIHTFIYEER